MNAIFVAWINDHSRTRLLAEAIGARPVFIWRGRVGGWRLALKYLRQGWDTVRVLLRERPEAILVQTPPIFPALLACVYALFFRRTRVILDAHSGSFLSPKWRWSLGLHRWCSRRADLTVVHVPSLAQFGSAWRVPIMVGSYVSGAHLPRPAPYPLPAGFNVVVPSSFNADEPIEAVWAAAEQMPEANFLVTGNAARLPSGLRENCPANLRLTGYLETSAYLGLLAAADAVLVLTRQPRTLQWGGIEAVWLGRPLVTSDWEDLRVIFAGGTLFVQNTPGAIVKGLRQAQADRHRLQAEISQLRRDMEQNWNDFCAAISQVVHAQPGVSEDSRGVRIASPDMPG